MRVGEVVAVMKLDLAQFQQGLRQANRMLVDHQQQATQVATTLGGLGVLIGAPLALATKEAAAFENMMRHVNTTLGAAAPEFDRMTESIRRMAGATGHGPTELAKAMYTVASSGFAGAQALEVLETSARISVAGMADLDAVVKTFTGTMMAYGYGAEKAGYVADVLYKTAQRAKMSFGDLAANMGEIVSAAARANLSLEDIGAALSTMTRAGVIPAEAFTSLNRLIMSLVDPQEKAVAAAHRLGVEWGAQALTTKGLNGIFAELVQKMGLTDEGLKELEASGRTEAEIFQILAQRAGITMEQFAAIFPEMRALRGGLALAAQGGKVFAGEFQAMSDSVGAAATGFEQQSMSLTTQAAKVKAATEAWAISLGQGLIPLLKVGAGTMGQLAQAAELLPGSVRVGIAIVGTATAGVLGMVSAYILFRTHGEEAVRTTARLIMTLGGLRSAMVQTRVAMATGGPLPFGAGAAVGLRGGRVTDFIKPGDYSQLRNVNGQLIAVAASTGRVAGAFRTASVAVRAFFASMGPIGWALLSIPLVTAAWGALRDHIAAAREEAEKQTARTREQADALKDLLPQLQAINREIDKARAKGGQPSEAQIDTQKGLAERIAEVAPELVTHDIATGQARLAIPLGKAFDQLNETQRAATEDLVNKQEATVRSATNRLGELQKRLADVQRRRAEAEREAAMPATTKTMALSSSIAGVTMEVPATADEQKRLNAERKRAAIDLAEQEEKAAAAVAKARRDLDNQNRTMAALTEAKKTQAMLDAEERAATEKAAAQRRTEHEGRQRQVTDELEMLRKAGVSETNIRAFEAKRRSSIEASASLEVQALWADMAEAQGRVYDAAVMRAVVAYGKQMALAKAAEKDGKKRHDLTLQAQLALQADLSKAEREQTKTTLEERRKRLQSTEQAVRQEGQSWRESAEAMRNAGRITTAEYIRQLAAIIEWLTKLNTARRAAGQGAVGLEEVRRLSAAILTERKQLQDSLRQAEEKAHTERLRWTQEERQAIAGLYQHQLNMIGLVFQHEADLRTIQGEEQESWDADIAAKRLEALRKANPANQPWMPPDQQRRLEQMQGAAAALADAMRTAGGGTPEQAAALQRLEAEQAAIRGQAKPYPAEASAQWASAMREAALTAYQGGRLSADDARAALEEAYAAQTKAQQDLTALAESEFARRQAEHEKTLSQIETEGATARREIAAVGNSITTAMEQIGNAYRRELDATLARHAPAMQSAGRVTGGAAGPQTVNLYLNGERVPAGTSRAQAEKLAGIVEEIIADHLEHAELFPRE